MPDIPTAGYARKPIKATVVDSEPTFWEIGQPYVWQTIRNALTVASVMLAVVALALVGRVYVGWETDRQLDKLDQRIGHSFERMGRDLDRIGK